MGLELRRPCVVRGREAVDLEMVAVLLKMGLLNIILSASFVIDKIAIFFSFKV